MTEDNARALIRTAIQNRGGNWADLGAGTGTFTRALAALLGSGGSVAAVEPNAKARRELTRLAADKYDKTRATITVSDGDFTKPLALSQLSGILLANSLHFVSHDQQTAVLSRLTDYLQSAGRIVLVEYDREAENRWVPYPVSLTRLDALCIAAGLAKPVIAGRTPSAFGGDMYCAFTTLA